MEFPKGVGAVGEGGGCVGGFKPKHLPWWRNGYFLEHHIPIKDRANSRLLSDKTQTEFRPRLVPSQECTPEKKFSLTISVISVSSSSSCDFKGAISLSVML